MLSFVLGRRDVGQWTQRRVVGDAWQNGSGSEGNSDDSPRSRRARIEMERSRKAGREMGLARPYAQRPL